ncbi:MAG: hypothetical protein ACYC6Y_06775 [Thermoguttaceae bacterium]
MKATTFSIALLLLGVVASRAPAAEPLPPIKGLLENEDSTDIFYTSTFPDGKAGEVIDRYVDVIAGAGVDALFCNTNARRTNYRSAVWESFWDGYDPAAPDDQPFFAAVPADERAGYRKLIHNMYEVDRQGVDYPARVVARCRQRGVSPWISIRMNDVHFNDNLGHPFHGRLWRREELFRKGHPGYFARALDYAHPEVRDHYMALVRETLERYDIDGLELDFMREPYLFSVGQEQAGAQLLTAWLGEVRRLVDEAAARRGHPVRLGVRVPFDPETALALGLDAPAWARGRLVDLVTVTPRWRTMVFDIPIGRWRELLGDQVALGGGLEVRYHPHPAASTVVAMDPDNAVGAAVAVLSQGADAVYLFNYFQNAAWPLTQYQGLLGKFSSLDELSKLPRRHAVTVREVVAPGQGFRPSLPAVGKDLSFRLPLGPRPPADWKVVVTLELAGPDAGPAPLLKVNDTAGQPAASETLGANRVLTWSVPVQAVSGKNTDTIAVASQSSESITVHRVEVRLSPP